MRAVVAHHFSHWPARATNLYHRQAAACEAASVIVGIQSLLAILVMVAEVGPTPTAAGSSPAQLAIGELVVRPTKHQPHLVSRGHCQAGDGP